jgi:asparagine synthase (glutamine-hydrolysing)
MCGILGIRRFDDTPVDLGRFRLALGTLRHRGPDGEGVEQQDRTTLGHTRLSIIDLAGSPQPMRSVNGPVSITFNGEIFNYRALREALGRRGVSFHTQGDTEVLLETLRLDGVAGLGSINGQFAFAYHDHTSGDLVLARDRLGILPLYYTEGPGYIAFASEVKALLPFVDDVALDEATLEDYLIFRSAPAPQTLFRGVHKLEPGTCMVVTRDNRRRIEHYWRLPVDAVTEDVSVAHAVDLVAAELARAVELRLVADVPVGAYLSGGLDSSLCTALMKRARGGGSVETFAAGFGDPRFDELPYARVVAEALGTHHHEVVVTPGDFEALWSELTWHRDGPISEPADIAIYRIARYARSTVKVLLSGEGSDELFAGYPKHMIDRALRGSALVPTFLRVPLARAVERVLPLDASRPRIAARALAARSTAERIQTWFAPFTWYERSALRPGYGAPRALDTWGRARGDHLRRMLYVDCHTWLADNLLERGDRMSMAASIENRPPFLDHHLVELAFRLDSGLKTKGRSGKWIVKEVARRFLPDSIVNRRKVGFRVPLDEWFRGELRDFTVDLLTSPSSFVGNYFDRKVVSRMLEDHLSRRRNEELRLWTLVGLEVFHRRCVKGWRDHRPGII